MQTNILMCLHRGNDTLCSDTDDNVHFTLGKDAGRQFRLLIYADGFRTPEWFKGGVMYQIFTDRFAKSGKSPLRQDVCNESDWYAPISQFAEKPGDPLKNDLFYGGDLYGISEKLAYLKELGVTVLYLNPVFKAASNHKYDTGDYNTADPAFGGDEALSALFAEAKKYGIRVILDGVFNHTGDDSLYFNKYGNYPSVGAYKHPESPYRDWYTFGKDDDDYECWWGIKIHPRLRQANPDCRSFFCGRDGVGAKYVKEGSGGWRLDVADELPDSLIRDIRAAMKEEKEDSLLLGEVWEDASNKVSYGALREYFLGSELDATMHYPFRTAVLDFLLGKIHAQAACDAFWTIQEHYPKENLYAALNLIGSHDRARVLTVLGGDVNALKMAMFLQFALPGVPSIYYGDEAGMTGGTDPYNRGSFPWGKGNAPLTDFVRSLTAMYQETPLLRRGECEMVFFGENVLGCRRFDESGSVLALVNRGEEAVECFGVTVPGRGYILE